MIRSSSAHDFLLPSYEITVSPETQQVSLKSCNYNNEKIFSQRYSFDYRSYEKVLFSRLPRRLADLLELVNLIYLADRLAPRRPRGSTDSPWRPWKRHLQLSLPVRDLDFWQDAKVSEQLASVLDYITEDRWCFAFRRLTNAPSQSSLDFKTDFKVPDNTFIALFSGGLDSFAGTTTYLSNHNFDCICLISAVTNQRMKGTQKSLVRPLKRAFNRDIIYMPIMLQLRERTLPDHLEEKSQRSRGFLFCVLGSVFSFHAGRRSLNLFENGIGAINLPMAEFQIGTDNTRATNPLALLEMSKLLSMIFDEPFIIENLALWSTKTELCRALIDSPLRQTISQTVSCDGSFSRRVRRKRQCGVCTSCLLRRLSLTAADLVEADLSEGYQFDILKASSIENANRLFQFKAMRKQVQKLKTCLEAHSPWFELSRSYPMLEEIRLSLGNLTKADTELIQNKILCLYSNYVHEWSMFESRIN